MARDKKPDSRPFPSKAEVIAFVQDSPTLVGKREIARAFGIKGGDRIPLKALLRELKQEGVLERGPRRKIRPRGHLPAVAVLEVSGIDEDGELLARPAVWDEDTAPPTIYLAPEKRSRAALAVGDRVLAKLRRIEEGAYEAQPIRKIAKLPSRVLGLYEIGDQGGRLRPTDKRAKHDYILHEADAKGAEPGELVLAEVRQGRPRLGLREVRVIERLGAEGDTHTLSLIAIHEHQLPVEFSPEALDEAAAAGPAKLGKRVDLRELPLVTIDGADARDFDDAVWAGPTRTREIPTAGTCWSRSPTSPGTCARTTRSIAPPSSAATPPTSPTGWCRCCPRLCRPAGARSTRTRSGPAWRPSCGSMRGANRASTASGAG